MRAWINGLSVERVDGDAPAHADRDIIWRVIRDDDLPLEAHDGVAFLRVEGEATPAGIITHHIFGTQGRIRCRFSVGPDGREVVTRVAPQVAECDVIGLFCEPVMRTILVRRGLPSLHAAALSRDGRTIVVMGQKGAGKSTLSAALQQLGWSVVADDLVRVATIGGVWHCFAGHRQTKLTPAAAAHFGARGLNTRWRSATEGDETDDGKLLLPPDPNRAAPPVSPITALLILGTRRPDLAGVECVPASAVEVMRAMLANGTPDPLAPAGATPALDPGVISGLAAQARVYRITLPDRLAELATSARTITALIEA